MRIFFQNLPLFALWTTFISQKTIVPTVSFPPRVESGSQSPVCFWARFRSGHSFILGTLSALKTDGFTFITLLKQRANGCSRARKVFLMTHREQWRV